jgi:hypothetical protein
MIYYSVLCSSQEHLKTEMCNLDHHISYRCKKNTDNNYLISIAYTFPYRVVKREVQRDFPFVKTEMMLNGDLIVSSVIQSIMRCQRKKNEKGVHAWVPPCAAYMAVSLY